MSTVVRCKYNFQETRSRLVTLELLQLKLNANWSEDEVWVTAGPQEKFRSETVPLKTKRAKNKTLRSEEEIINENKDSRSKLWINKILNNLSMLTDIFLNPEELEAIQFAPSVATHKGQNHPILGSETLLLSWVHCFISTEDLVNYTNFIVCHWYREKAWSHPNLMIRLCHQQ